MAKQALGRGLGALLPSMDMDEDNKDIREIKLTEIEPNKAQPRKSFDSEKLELLADSIKNHGIIQPIIVKKLDSGFYQIIAGERRWRAARLAGLKSIPVVIKDYDKKEVMEIALIENLQREDLNPMEESEGYKNLMDEFNLTQEEISERVGKSRSAIANSLRLLNLSDHLKEMLVDDKLSSGHARALLSLEDKQIQLKAAEKIIDEGLSVRETEKLVKSLMQEKNEKSIKKIEEIDHHYSDIENKLSQCLGTKVKIHNGKNKGKIEIEYYSHDDFDRLLAVLNNSKM